MESSNFRGIFKDNLKHYMSLNRIKQTDIAQALNVSKSTVSSWCSGLKIPRMDKIEELAKLFGIQKSDLIEKPVPQNIIPVDENMKFARIPVIGRVAAGTTCFADVDIIDYNYTPANNLTAGEQYVFLQVTGDSMYPLIQEGDHVLVRCQTSVDSGSYAVVIVDDEDGVVKKLVYGKDFIELHSVNPMYPIRRFEGRDVTRIRVFGLVKEILRKL